MGIQISKLFLLEQLLQEQECWCQLIPKNFMCVCFLVHYYSLSLLFWFTFFVIVLASTPKLSLNCHDEHRCQLLLSIMRIEGLLWLCLPYDIVTHVARSHSLYMPILHSPTDAWISFLINIVNS